jgi:hypothetical protein
VAREPDPDELIDRWTLVGGEPELAAGKRGATRLGFALLLRFYTDRGRFPRGRGELPDAAVDYVGRQVGVAAAELAFYEWTGRTIEFHRRQIRLALGFRECGVADADKLTEWLVSNVTQVERGNATFAAREQTLWGQGSTAVASDSTHFRVFDQNIFTEWHSRYGRHRHERRGQLRR